MDPQLIKTLPEVSAQVPVNMTSNLSTIKPFLRTAEVTWVQRLIGTTQFDALVTLYQPGADPAPNANQTEAIKLCQKVIANMGYFFATPILSVSIGTSGITVTSNDQTKQAFQWQVSDLKDALLSIGFQGIEELLQLLEDNPEDFAAYSASAERQSLKELLITSAAAFTEYYEISASRLVFQSVAYIIRRIQKQDLLKLYGADLLDTLKGDDLTDPQLQLLNDYIRPGLALLTVAKALIERVVTLENGRVAFNFKGRDANLAQTQPMTAQQLSDMSDQLVRDGNIALQDGLQFIADHAMDFPGFTAPTPRRRFQFTNKKHKGLAGF